MIKNARDSARASMNHQGEREERSVALHISTTAATTALAQALTR